MAALNQTLLLVGRMNYVWTNTESLFIYLIAQLMGTSKQAAIVVFLTLNTTRARLDLITRLAKLPSTQPEDRTAVLAFAERLGRESGVRNKLNHCIYSFDETGAASTQLMRIADVGDDVRYGKVELLDDTELQRLNAAIERIAAVNRDIWAYIRSHGITP
ncbi:hypothetical protein IC608_15160 [Devosia sp. PTR5]|uniref:Uncharacterized protein n=1 Tax=Devosia oryzisoli TaxID=2774138 RepID=A0A927IUD7_9HYPH|nr:hypothetical protein [Devosia oryzisoli]MBD8066812.1 hypothetical protein [Devosia oryzisoli]